jgi:hypothetical protein
MSIKRSPKHWIIIFAAICVFTAARPSPTCVAQPSSLPHLRKQGAATQLIDVLTQLAPLILDHQGKNEMAGFLPEGPEQRAPQQARLGGYTLNVIYERPSSPVTQGAQTSDAVSGGLAIAVGSDEFIFAGTGLVVTFEANAPGPPLVGVLSAQEGKYVEGQWQPGRWLNGDQTHQGRHLRLPPGKFDIQRVKLYRYR